MADSFHRLMRILRHIPRAPRWVDTETLHQMLASEGIEVEVRTIQRDLQRLSGRDFGLECLDTSKPYRWRFIETAESVLFPRVDPQSALALRLAELYLDRLLPKATLRALQPHLDAAKRALDGKPVARWLERVRLVPRMQPLLRPRVDGEVLGVVHEALLEDRQIEARYRSVSKNEGKEMTLHPLGLVYRDSVAYLVATAFDKYNDPRIYPLHRFESARLSEHKAKEPPPGFSLDSYVARGELGFRHADDVALELLFDERAARVLEETPLHQAQKITRRDDGFVLIEAHVPDTQVLRSWILGFGPSVEVLGPPSVRQAVAAAHRAAAARYAGGGAPSQLVDESAAS
jgi:predicted DNA-binding transcriptional regulator YafY